MIENIIKPVEQEKDLETGEQAEENLKTEETVEQTGEAAKNEEAIEKEPAVEQKENAKKEEKIKNPIWIKLKKHRIKITPKIPKFQSL